MKSFVLFVMLALLVAPLLMGAAPNPQAPPQLADLLAMVTAFFASWQVKVLLGLIVLDVVLGVAGALKTNTFDLKRFADFYKVLVLPYVLGYLAVFVVIGYVIPADSLGSLGEPITQGAVTLAWATLVGSLLGRIRENWSALYGQPAAQ